MYSVLFHCTFCESTSFQWVRNPSEWISKRPAALKNLTFSPNSIEDISPYQPDTFKMLLSFSRICDLFATCLLATMTSIEVFRFSWCGMVGAWWSLDWCQHPWGRWIWTSMASSSPWAAQNAAWWFDWWGKRIHSRMREWLDYIRVSIGSLCICKVVFNMMVLF